MHQDQRIGLALGVLLIGACAAFFFRNETREMSNTPRLQRAQELDDRIAERSTRPYLKGVEAVEAADRSRMRSVADQRTSSDGSDEDHGGAYWSPVEPFSSKKPAGDRKPHARLTDSDSDILELAPIPVPSDHAFAKDKSHGKESSEIPAGAVRTGSKPDDSLTDGRTHVVQKGETLSSIAAKRLGSASRFHEIFDANQDQLKDANDLKSGMTIRIPETRAESPSKHSTTKARTAIDVETSTVEQSSTHGNSPNDAENNSIDVQSRAPKHDPQGPPLILTPTEPSNEPRTEVPVESLQIEEATPAKKFVPARRFTPPTRPTGPQAKGNDSASEKVSR